MPLGQSGTGWPVPDWPRREWLRGAGAVALGLRGRGRRLAEGEPERAMGCFTRARQIRVALNEPRQASTQRTIDALTAMPCGNS